MRVLQLISSAGFYGAENVVVQLSRALLSLDCEVTVGVFRNEHRQNLEIADRARSHGLPVEIIDCRGRFDRQAVARLRARLRPGAFDILHAHGYKADLYAIAAARSLPVVRIATCHNWTAETRMVRLYSRLDRLALRRFDRAVAVSAQVADILRSSGVEPRRIARIDNGIDTEAFRAAAASLGDRANKGPRIGMAARLDPAKGGEILLRAAPEVLSRFPGARFYMTGEGPDRERLEGIAAGLGIASSVEFTGARTDMPGVYASFDIFVLPSFNEGLPMVLLEAMAAGLPVVATPVGAIPELLAGPDGEAGILVPTGQPEALAAALIRLCEDPAGASAMGERGRAIAAARYSSAVMAQRYRDLYREAALRGHS